MPEIKHNFTGGKMNKDLDERLVPNGEYRDAMNIQISTSEGSEVGTAQNILGNSLIAGQDFIPENAVCVGSIADEKNDKLYYFITQKNLLINGDFNGNGEGWGVNSQYYTGDQWTFSNNQAVGTSGDAGTMVASAPGVVDGNNYTITYDIVEASSSGSLILANHSFIGGINTNGTDDNVPLIGEETIGTYTVEWEQGPSPLRQNNIWLSNSNDYDGTIDNLTVLNADEPHSLIVEYNSVTNSITPVLVDTNGDVLKFSENNIITGVNIIDDLLFWTDNHSEPKKINIHRCIEGTDTNGLTHTKLINESRGYDINSNIDLKEEHITVIRKSPKIAPSIELFSGQYPGLTYGGIMKITPNPGGLTAGGANFQNLSSFINASNQYYDFSQFSIGSQFSTRIETDLQGNSGFTLSWDVNDTVVLKEFGGANYDEVPSSPITNYSMKAKVINVIQPIDDVAELSPNGDFILPNSSGSKPFGWDWDSVFTYDSVNNLVKGNGANYGREMHCVPTVPFEEDGVYKISITVSDHTQGQLLPLIIGNTSYSFYSSGNIPYWYPVLGGSTQQIQPTPGTFTHEFTLTLNSTSSSNGVDYGGGNSTWGDLTNKFALRSDDLSNNGFGFNGNIESISIERQDVTDAQVELEITGFEGTPPATPPNYTELKYAVEKLNEEEKLFEYKFPRFAYRYQYEDKEYSTFSPFTQVAFLPGSFDYHPRNAYNLGMVNNVNEIKLSRFIPTTAEGQDIVAVDILYKDEASSNVYVVDTIKNNQHNSNIWINDEYVVKSEIIKRILPSNQLLRPWDAVPKKALAQEISGNRIIYANYTQGFDLFKPGTKQEYYPDFNVSIKSNDVGLSTVKSIKSLREYQLGVIFIDKYGRETPVLSNSTGGKKIAKKDSNKSNQIEVSFASAVFPENLEYFKFFIKETSGEYYNMSMDRWWDAGDGLAWLSFPSSDINKIDVDTFLILKKGVGSNNLVEDKARYKVLAIETEAPDFIKTNKILLEEKTQIFTSNDDSLFGNTINNAPLLGRNSFQINYAPFQDSAGSELHNVKEQEGILYIEFAIGDGTSDRYRIAEISQPSAIIADAKYNIKLDKKLGDDVNFICDDPLGPTKIVDNTVVRIYKYLPENSSEFDGRFFVKVNKDDVFNTNVYAETIGSTSYRVSVSKKLYYMGSNQKKLHSSELTNQTAGIYDNPMVIPAYSGAGNTALTYGGGGVNDNLTFGSFAPFFRNYKFASTSEYTLYSQVSVGFGGVQTIGQYKFDDTDESKWKAEAAFHTHACTPLSGFSNQFPPNNGLKNADDSSFDAGERYGVFNDEGEQEKGNVWFIDGGPYSGEREGGNSLDWPFIHSTNGVEQGLVQGNQSSSMIIAMGGIYHGTENTSGNNNTPEFFNIGRDNGNPYYNSTQFKDLVGKISPSVKFRFREDPTGEIYTIQPSGVNFHRRLRWSDGDIMSNAQTDEYPAWVGNNDSRAAQLSPNFSMGYKTTFKNSSETGAINWDPTGGGVTGPITGGLKLTVPHGSTPITLNAKQLFVSNIHDLTCSVNGGKHSITVGMILTKYGAISLGGSFNDPNGTTNSSFSLEPLIVSDIVEVTGGNGFVLKLAGYSSPLFTSTPPAGPTALGLLQHKITDASPSTGHDLVFQQPAMNGYSQYSVNRINVELPGGLADPALLAVGYTIEFLEKVETESEFPSNPAIWETEPKETTDLDVYYEASGYNPLVLSDETKNIALPIGSIIEHIENPVSVPTGTTINNVVDNGTDWTLELNNDVLVGGVYITSGANASNLKITKPDGSSIVIEVTGFLNASNNLTNEIKISENLYGPDTRYTLGWHNCYSFGNGVESNRIRDTYNLPFIANGVKVSTTLDENPYEEELKYGLIYSDIYNGAIGVNNLNQFIAAEKITKNINPTYGSIQKLKAGWGQGGDLITLCEDRVLKILANKDALFNADGNTNLTSTNNVLGQAIPYSGEYGISKNPESFASEAYRAYFTDKVRGAVMRLSMDGLTPISNAGMRDWFRDNLKLSNKLIGSYDDRQDEYNISLEATTEKVAKTVSYKEDVKGWVSFKSFAKETGVSCANGYYTFAGARLWKHHVENLSELTKVTVTGIEHVDGSAVDGKYFFFEINEMNKLLGGNWFNTVTKIKQYRDNLLIKEDEVRLFGNIGNSLNPPSPSGGVTKGHGRYELGSEAGDWKVGDIIVIGNIDRNTFYDTFTNSSLNVLLNDTPGSIKSYHTLEYEGSQSRVSGIQKLTVVETLNATPLPAVFTDFSTVESFFTNSGLTVNIGDTFLANIYRDDILIESDITLTNVDPLLVPPTSFNFEVGDVITTQLQENSVNDFNSTPADGWHVSSIETNKKKGSLLEFIEKEGKWFNYIKGVESNIDETTDFASFDIQGLGTIQSIDNNDITINGDLNVSLQIEDVIYFNSTQIEIVGKVTAINDNTITVDNSGTLPSQDDYIFFVKNQVVNMSNLSGYYADAKFENNSKVKAELYAVSSEVTESSK